MKKAFAALIALPLATTFAHADGSKSWPFWSDDLSEQVGYVDRSEYFHPTKRTNLSSSKPGVFDISGLGTISMVDLLVHDITSDF